METKARRAWFQLLLFAAAAVGVPALIPHHETTTRRSSREDLSLADVRDSLEQSRAELVILGDSMVPCRVDDALLTSATGWRCRSLSWDGSATASWYLILKNVVARVHPRPNKVVFFFRDTYWHLPRYRTTGRRVPFLNSLREGAEPAFDALVLGKDPGRIPVLAWAEDLVDATWRIDGYQEEAAERIRDLALDATSLGGKRKARIAHLDRIFSLHNLRRDLANDLVAPPDGSEHDLTHIPLFDVDPKHTFLPHVEEVAARAGIRLGFYRVRQRRHTVGASSSADGAELRAYLAAFQAWCVSRGHAWMDESTDEGIRESHFADGDHTRDEDRPFLTPRVARRLVDGLGGVPQR